MASQVLASLNNRTVLPYRLLDAWRGVAVLWVVMIHSCLPTIASETPALAKLPLYAFSLWGQLGVMMFFVISGYCITAAVDSALKKPNALIYFLRARLRRIYPPYFASSALTVLFSFLLAFLASHGVVPKWHHPPTFLGQPFLFYFAALTITQLPLHVRPISDVYWSLCYEITFYALVALCLGMLGRRSKRTFYSGLNVLTLLSLMWLIVSPSTCPFPLNLWYQFGLGALVYMLITHPQNRVTQIYFGATVVLAISFAYLHQGAYSLGHPSSRIQTLFCVAFALILLGLYRFDGALTRYRAVKTLEWLGAFSYSLYLSHFFVLPFPKQIANRLRFVGEAYWVSFLFQIVVAIAFAYVFHLIFERPFLSSRAKVREAQIQFQKAPGKQDAGDGLSETAVTAPRSRA